MEISRKNKTTFEDVKSEINLVLSSKICVFIGRFVSPTYNLCINNQKKRTKI